MPDSYQSNDGDEATSESIIPFYRRVHNETEVFKAAWKSRHAVMLKGPTGCGKTRFVESMAAELRRPLVTVSCHEDLTAADLLGRYLLKGGETVWIDGPLTRAVRQGAICYLDEVVEARADTTVAIHALTDYRRQLYVERLGETLTASPEFMLVISYNPGYQSILKDLKPSTRQRMASIELGFPPADIELEILIKESGVDPKVADDLVRLAGAIRTLDIAGLPEVSSTRSLIAAADLIRAGLRPREAVEAGMIGPLCDDPAITASLMEMVDVYITK
ncbi:MAG: nirQ 1 [Hydrocarboniphaga sp.]|uniref:CbbQ/NirQ/NorQ/GpvN family protein n=1 Tax=Hydrocarboniphaga sp. TaxID=2033016 RepID=UPI0026025A7D|nr:CbbQ/NirQ/NorQ/GpvN family protein [Hydrocarboniphaga sp.]MDB5970051.1 nirQ 1 [Hydrocarboniphaga sp.]